jgi:hypothetical protein
VNDLLEDVAFEVVTGADPRLENPKAVANGAEPCLRRGSGLSSEGAVEVDCCWDGDTGMFDGLLNSPPPDISALNSLVVVDLVN